MNKKKDIIKFALLSIFLLTIITCGIIFSNKIKENFNFENVREFIGDNKLLSYVIFIFLQILQVVIFIIPGDIINATGGFVFNMFLGSILSSTRTS